MGNDSDNAAFSKEILEFHFSQFQPVWQHWNHSKALPPVTIFVGPIGSGKDLLIRHISQMLQCQNGVFHDDSSDNMSLFGNTSDSSKKEMILKPCGNCYSCTKASSNSWVDYVEIEAERNSDGKPSKIKLGALEVIQKKLGFKAHESPFQIFHIKDAELLTPQASNSLLKILEEPPESWIFFLSTSDANLLLPTLRSRSQVFRMKSIPDEVIDQVLSQDGAPANKRQVAIRIASGDVLKARDLLTAENWELRQKVFQFIFSPATHMMELIEYTHKKPKSLDMVLDQLETIIHDLLLEDQRACINVDFRDQLQKYKTSMYGTPSSKQALWHECNRTIQQTRAHLNLPLNRKIMAQNLLTPWFPKN